MFRSWDIQTFVFLTIPSWFTKSVTLWWVLVHETGCIFDYLLNHTSLTNQTWSINRRNQEHIFPKSFEQFGGQGLSSRPFQFSNLFQLLNNQSCQVLHFSERMNKGKLKIININTKIWQILLYSHFIKIIVGPRTISSL